MIAVYDKNLKFIMTASGFVNGGLQCADGVHYVTKDGSSLHQDATSVGPWEQCTPSGQMLVFGVDPTTVYTWAKLP